MHPSLYDELWAREQSHWWFLGRRRILQSLVERFQPNEDRRRLRVCDLGCGCGANLLPWADEHDVLGIDPTPQALRYAKRRLGDRVRSGRLPDYVPVAEASQDVVLLTDVLEHVEDDTRAARRALELLKPGGILVATVPAYRWLTSPRDAWHQHLRRYGKEDFHRLFDVPGVRLELLSHFNTLLFPFAAVKRLASRISPPVDAAGDLHPPVAPINAALARLFAFEQRLLGRVTLPFGLSLVAIARREESAVALAAGPLWRAA